MAITSAYLWAATIRPSLLPRTHICHRDDVAHRPVADVHVARDIFKHVHNLIS